MEFLMNNTHAAGRQHGLTLLQLVLLFVAFMVGLGGSFVLREFIPPASAHAGIVQTTSIHSDPVR